MLIRILDQPAYLLHRRDWRNSSLILDLLTRDFGRVSALAKGGKTSRSKAFYQPFVRLCASWTGKNELKTLIGVDGVSLPVDEHQYLSLLYINELICAFLVGQESHTELFDLYESLLQSPHLGDAELREFEKQLMQLLGYLPDTLVEAKSRLMIESDQYYQFLASEGFVLCRYEDNHAIDGATIIAWNEKQYQHPLVMQMAKIVMRSIIDFNLQGKPLKSRDIYRQIKSHL